MGGKERVGILLFIAQVSIWIHCQKILDVIGRVFRKLFAVCSVWDVSIDKKKQLSETHQRWQVRRSVKCVNSSNHGVSNKEIINLASVFVADIFIYPIHFSVEATRGNERRSISCRHLWVVLSSQAQCMGGGEDHERPSWVNMLTPGQWPTYWHIGQHSTLPRHEIKMKMSQHRFTNNFQNVNLCIFRRFPYLPSLVSEILTLNMNIWGVRHLLPSKSSKRNNKIRLKCQLGPLIEWKVSLDCFLKWLSSLRVT